MEGKKSCSNCYWGHQCSEDEVCKEFDPVEEVEEVEDLTEREEFYLEWNQYIKENTF